MTDQLSALVDRVPVGWTAVRYDGRRWSLRRADHGGGRSVTIEAEALDGSAGLGANVFRRATGDELRPCEIPAEVVLDFLRGWESDDGRKTATP